jgi:hypothetical protein
MGIHLNASRAEGRSNVFNWVFNDRSNENNQNQAVTALSNSVVNHVIGCIVSEQYPCPRRHLKSEKPLLNDVDSKWEQTGI